MAAREEAERWAMHYSSSHQILLVGDGDFSFSLSLARSFASASNIVSSSVDPYDAVINKYKNAKSNLEHLKKMGALILHGVDATNMRLHSDLRMRRFDRIIFNFPHAGFHGKEDNARLIRMHRRLVNGFLGNASFLLRHDGEVHVNHKMKAPFSHWKIEELANGNSLALIECVNFKKEDFPGYSNKRGDGSRCDEPFFLGECCTFKFCLYPALSKKFGAHNFDFRHNRYGQFEGIRMPMPMPMPTPTPVPMPTPTPVPMPTPTPTPMPMQQNPTVLQFRHPQWHNEANIDGSVPCVDSPPATMIRIECARVFSEYLSYVVKTFGSDIDVGGSALGLGFQRFVAEAPGRPLSHYILLLKELHNLSILRSAWLRKMLYGYGF